jgi:hypothetical protein
MRVQFKKIGDENNPSLEVEEFDIYRLEDSHKIGMLVWRTGSEDGWYFSGRPDEPNAWVRLCDLSTSPHAARLECAEFLEKRFGCDIVVVPSSVNECRYQARHTHGGDGKFAKQKLFDNAVEKLLVCSWREIAFDYDKLTDVEKSYVSGDEHTMLHDWLAERGAIRWTEVGTKDGQPVMDWDVAEKYASRRHAQR